MRWGATGYGAHTEKAAAGAARDWYFAEGSQGFFSTYLAARESAADGEHRAGHLLPRERAAAAARPIRWRRARGPRSTPEQMPSCATSRSARASRSICPAWPSARCTSAASPLWSGGHESAGVTAPSTDVVPGGRRDRARTSRRSCCSRIRTTQPAEVDADVPAGRRGVPVTQTVTIAARQRLTLNIAARRCRRSPTPRSRRRSSRDAADRRRARAVLGPRRSGSKRTTASASPRPRTRWGLAEGRVGGADGVSDLHPARESRAAEPADVTITFLRDDGHAGREDVHRAADEPLQRRV